MRSNPIVRTLFVACTLLVSSSRLAAWQAKLTSTDPQSFEQASAVAVGPRGI